MQNELTLEEILSVMFKNWVLVFIIPLLLAFSAFAYLTLSVPKIKPTPAKYETSAILQIGRVGTTQVQSIDSISKNMSAPEIRKELIEKINIQEKDFELFYENSSGLLSVRAVSTSSITAATVANSAALQVEEKHKAIFKTSKKKLFDTIDEAKKNAYPSLLTITLNEVVCEPTKIITLAINPTSPIQTTPPANSSSKKWRLFLAILVSMFFLNLMIAFYMEGKNKRTSQK